MNQEEKWLLDEKYQGQKNETFQADCKRLATGEPLAYVIGSIPFLDCTIYLDSQPLIPRPETEFWTEKAITEIQESLVKDQTSYAPRVLDLCAGSGCVGVAVAKAVPEATVDFAELEPSHLSTIATNLKTNLPEATSSRSDLELVAKNAAYRIFAADLFTLSPHALDQSSRSDLELHKYDYILSNPPYIDPVVDRTEISVVTHEPHLALYGGEAGLELIARIIEAAPDHLKPNGQLWLEHEPEQSKLIQALGTAQGFTTQTHKDQYEIERYSVLVLQ